MNRRRTTERISKLLSLMLRHRPQEFNVEVDDHGYTELDAVIGALQSRDGDITREAVEGVVNEGPKQRFEIVEGRIRARYGHSFEIDLGQDPVEPPEALYKGVEPSDLDEALKEGLHPFDRSYVHLSFDADVAGRLGRGGNAVVRVDARAAHAAGVAFYDCGSTILTKVVPAEFVSLERAADTERPRRAPRREAPARPAPTRPSPQATPESKSESGADAKPTEPSFGRRRTFRR